MPANTHPGQKTTSQAHIAPGTAGTHTHLMRRTAAQARLHLSVRQLLAQLAGIGETVLIHPSTGGRPKARRMTTELTGDQHELYEIFDLAKWAPRS